MTGYDGGNMQKVLQRIASVLFLLVVTASPVFAQQQQVNPDMDARLTGYTNRIIFEPPSVSGAWFLLSGLGLIAIGPLFLNAHRTHLD